MRALCVGHDVAGHGAKNGRRDASMATRKTKTVWDKKKTGQRRTNVVPFYRCRPVDAAAAATRTSHTLYMYAFSGECETGRLMTRFPWCRGHTGRAVPRCRVPWAVVLRLFVLYFAAARVSAPPKIRRRLERQTIRPTGPCPFFVPVKNVSGKKNEVRQFKRRTCVYVIHRNTIKFSISRVKIQSFFG